MGAMYYANSYPHAVQRMQTWTTLSIPHIAPQLTHCPNSENFLLKSTWLTDLASPSTATQNRLSTERSLFCPNSSFAEAVGYVRQHLRTKTNLPVLTLTWHMYFPQLAFKGTPCARPSGVADANPHFAAYVGPFLYNLHT